MIESEVLTEWKEWLLESFTDVVSTSTATTISTEIVIVISFGRTHHYSNCLKKNIATLSCLPDSTAAV